MPKQIKIADIRANSSTLREDDWNAIDQRIVQISRNDLVLVRDLVAAGLATRQVSLDETVAYYEKVSDMTPANISMNGAFADSDILTFSKEGTPIPIYTKPFTLGRGQLSKVQPYHIDTIVRNVNEKIDYVGWMGESINAGGVSLKGLLNTTHRATKNIGVAWGQDGATPYEDVNEMIQQLKDENKNGPYVLYVSSNLSSVLNLDYKAESQKTNKQRIEDLAEIGAGNVRIGYGLPDNTLILVQMTFDVIELIVAQPTTVVPLPERSPFQESFLAMAAMAVIVKTDGNGAKGICVATM